MTKAKAVFNWSGGKDSSIALHRILQNPEYSIERLFTSVNSVYDRISMHGVRRELLERQAESIGIPLTILNLPEKPTMNEYNTLLYEQMKMFMDEGYICSIFGDIFLEDLRDYREKQLKKIGFKSLFPIWKEDTRNLMEQFIKDGFKAITVCIKAEKLDVSFAGRVIDHDFLQDLPDDVDPCGEYGEFHTFVYDGPIFSEPVSFRKGEIVCREYKAPEQEKDKCDFSGKNNSDKMGFWFCDLLPE